MENQKTYTPDQLLVGDTILQIERDILSSMLNNLNKYVENANDVSNATIIPIITSSLIMSIQRLEESFHVDVGSMIVELINNQNKRKLN